MCVLPDTWNDGSTYEAYVGRWSRLVAGRFLAWLAVPPHAAWLDLGCGTGALAQTILAEAAPRLVVGCDRSVDYVRFAARRTADGRAQFLVADLPALPYRETVFDAVVAGLVLNFLPAPDETLRVLRTHARSGGTIAAYVWDYAEGVQFMRVFWDAAVSLDPAARRLDEGTRFPLCRPEPLRHLFESAGLHHVGVEPIDVPTAFPSFDDYWTPFLGGQGPAPGYTRSLSPERRMELRDAVRLRLPTAADGTISLTARAWAAKGTVP